MRLFDIIIPTYNNLQELKSCLRGLEDQTLKAFRVWVCVDGSTDGTLAYFEKPDLYRFSYRLLTHPDGKNHGRAATRNLALPHLSAPYVVFLDSDLSVKEGFLEQHLRVVQQDRISVGAAVYGPATIWRDYLQGRGMYRRPEPRQIPFKYFESGNAALPARLFKEVGGFDTHFTGYGGEDIELAARMATQFTVAFEFNPQAAAYGNMYKTLREGLQQRGDFAKSGLRYIEKTHPELDDIFKLRFYHTFRAALLNAITPVSIIEKMANGNLLPQSLRLKLVHLLVFCTMYRGYQSGA